MSRQAGSRAGAGSCCGAACHSGGGGKRQAAAAGPHRQHALLHVQRLEVAGQQHGGQLLLLRDAAQALVGRQVKGVCSRGWVWWCGEGAVCVSVCVCVCVCV